MAEIALDLNLSSNLLLHSALLQFRLMEDFEGTNEAGRALLCQIYSSKLSFTQWLANFKHTEMQLLRCWLLVDRWCVARIFILI